MRKDAPIISCFHLALSAAEDSSKHLIEDISVDLQAGSWSEFVGEPGSGKSLLFGMLSLRLTADRGKLLFGGRNFGRLSQRGIADLRREITSCAERPLLLEDRTVLENLVLPFVVHGNRKDARARCEELLAEVGLTDRANVRVSALSHGERALVGALRALAPASSIILLDGVLEQLSDTPRRAVMRLLQARHLSGTTVVLFGRAESSNARTGQVFHLVDGKIDAVEAPQAHERVPETGGRIA